jgi:Leucine-rich repeat (LRR) protein
VEGEAGGDTDTAPLTVAPGGGAELDVAGNQLQTLPDSLHLPALARLNVSDNLFAALPPAALQWAALVHVDARRNRIATVPPAEALRAHWPQLTTLHLQGNPADSGTLEAAIY